VGTRPSGHVPNQHRGLWITLNDELEGPHSLAPPRRVP
jgi:hypothetical protein